MPDSHPIVACARGWIGTRFHHQGRVKKTATHKGGVDCLGLLVGVAHELQITGRNGTLLTLEDETCYSHQPDCVRFRARLNELLQCVSQEDKTEGDIALFRIDDRPQHLGIISDIGIIHAYAPARAVVEHALDGWWRQRIEAVFRVTCPEQ